MAVTAAQLPGACSTPGPGDHDDVITDRTGLDYLDQIARSLIHHRRCKGHLNTRTERSIISDIAVSHPITDHMEFSSI